MIHLTEGVWEKGERVRSRCVTSWWTDGWARLVPRCDRRDVSRGLRERTSSQILLVINRGLCDNWRR